MAYPTLTTFPDSTRERLRAMGGAIARGCERYVEIRSRRGEIEALDALGDAELAEIGLKRADIPHYVFRNVMTM